MCRTLPTRSLHTHTKNSPPVAHRFSGYFAPHYPAQNAAAARPPQNHVIPSRIVVVLYFPHTFTRSFTHIHAGNVRPKRARARVRCQTRRSVGRINILIDIFTAEHFKLVQCEERCFFVGSLTVYSFGFIACASDIFRRDRSCVCVCLLYA